MESLYDKAANEALDSRRNFNDKMQNSRKDYQSMLNNKIPIIGSKVEFQVPVLDPDLMEILQKQNQLRITGDTLFLIQMLRNQKSIEQKLDVIMSDKLKSEGESNE